MVEIYVLRSKDKSFCPHCRKNFMREFKEVKELKRAHKEASCTNWFCTPDTRFRCEVSAAFFVFLRVLFSKSCNCAIR